MKSIDFQPDSSWNPNRTSQINWKSNIAYHIYRKSHQSLKIHRTSNMALNNLSDIDYVVNELSGIEHFFQNLWKSKYVIEHLPKIKHFMFTLICRLKHFVLRAGSDPIGQRQSNVRFCLGRSICSSHSGRLEPSVRATNGYPLAKFTSPWYLLQISRGVVLEWPQ